MSFIDYVPKNPRDNLRWRIRMREAALRDVDVQEKLYDAAMRDVLFFFNAFLWVFEPRATIKVKPFVSWSHQDPVIVGIDEAIAEAERREEPLDVLLPKSRAQGGTYIYLGVGIRRWLRDPLFSMGLVTRTEDLVDSSNDSDAVMWKLCWMLERLPVWMLPKAGYKRFLTEHSVVNQDNNAAFVGYSAAADVGRGGRKTVFAADEIGARDFITGGADYAVMDSLQHVTNCRLLVSTFGSDTGAFYSATEDPGNATVLRLDWKDNPSQTKLAYTINSGVPTAVKPEEQAAVEAYVAKIRKEGKFQTLERRRHRMEGKLRSPWYDAQCLRPNATPRSIARELDMDPRGAVGKVFDPVTLDRMKKECCRPPVWEGNVIFDTQTLAFKGLIRQEGGPLKLWFQPDLENKPPPGRYAVGCDIAMGGTGQQASNSAVEGFSRNTGEQVMEYTVWAMPSTKFARVVVVLSRWLMDAYLGWEDSGMASPFATEVIEKIGYTNIFYRESAQYGTHEKTKNPGWWNKDDEAKAELLENMCIEMEEGKCIPRSEDLIQECNGYEWENGKIVFRMPGVVGVAGRSHGDRCIAGGVARLLCRDRPASSIGVDNQNSGGQTARYGTMAWRIEQDKTRRGQLGDDQAELTLADVLQEPV